MPKMVMKKAGNPKRETQNGRPKVGEQKRETKSAGLHGTRRVEE